MKNSPDTFDPARYIEGERVFDESIRALERETAAVKLRALLVWALGRKPEQVIAYFSEGEGEGFQVRVIASEQEVTETIVLDEHCQELWNYGFSTKVYADGTDSESVDNQVNVTDRERVDIIDGIARKVLIQYLKKRGDGYSVRSIAELKTQPSQKN